jgi:hypothetical protein
VVKQPVPSGIVLCSSLEKIMPIPRIFVKNIPDSGIDVWSDKKLKSF